MSRTSERLSIREISRRIDIPESTLRYYRNLFPDRIPTLGTGRNRRHPESALEVFALIGRLFGRGESRDSVRRRLDELPRTAADRTGLGFGPVVRQGDLDAGGRQAEHASERTDAHTGVSEMPVDRILSAMMVRDRELAVMHRELLDLVGRLIRTVDKMVTGPVADGLQSPRPEPATTERAEPVGGRDADAEAAPGGAGDAGSAEAAAELEELRQNLAREGQTVERLRRAKLELERRLAQYMREARR